MTIRLKLASKDGLPEGLPAEYLKPEGEGFILELPDGWGIDDVKGLRLKNQELLGKVTESKQRLQGFEGIDPAAVRDQLKELSELKANPDKLGGAKALEEAKKQLEALYGPQLKERDQKISDLTKRERDWTLGQALNEALAPQKDTPKALPGLDLVLGREVQLLEEGGKLIPVVVDPATGKPRLSTKMGSTGVYMQPSERVAELAKDTKWSHLFEGTGHAGSGLTGKGAGGQGANPFMTNNVTDMLKLMSENPTLAAQMQAQAQGAGTAQPQSQSPMPTLLP